MSILTVNNLTKIYTVGGDTTAALDHVSFSVEEGSFVAIVGTSGSGKSTLLHLIGGVDRPTEGSVFVDGKDIFEMNESGLSEYRRRTVSVIYQFYNLLPMLNVKANITLPLELANSPTESALTKYFDSSGLKKNAFITPISFQAVSNNASPLHGRS